MCFQGHITQMHVCMSAIIESYMVVTYGKDGMRAITRNFVYSKASTGTRYDGSVSDANI